MNKSNVHRGKVVAKWCKFSSEPTITGRYTKIFRFGMVLARLDLI